MSRDGAPLLVVAHEATRTGSPLVLLRLLEATRGRLPAPIAVRLRAEGPLSAALTALSEASPVVVRPAAVLVNSALASDVLDEFEDDVRMAVYVHEQGDALRTLSPRARDALCRRAHLVLVVSEECGRDVVALGAPPARIRVLPPVVVDTSPTEEEIERARKRLALTDGGRLVVGCGAATWRKGPDLFIVAAALIRRQVPTQFAWVGRRTRSFGRLLDADCATLGLTDHLTWVDEVEDPHPYLAAADVLMMTSREDPQPLVPIEAASARTPTAAFAVGGLAGMGAEGAALTVRYPDVDALAGAVAELLVDDRARSELVDRAGVWATEHHDITHLAPRFSSLMDELVRGELSSRAEDYE